MEKQKYRLSIIQEFEAIDDIEARQFIAGYLEDPVWRFKPEGTKMEIKLQRIFSNKPPEKVEIL